MRQFDRDLLKARLQYIAGETGRPIWDVITLCQAAAANRGDDEMLEALCGVKWEFWEGPKNDGAPKSGD